MNHPLFDRRKLRILPISERLSDLDCSVMLSLERSREVDRTLRIVADRIIAARKRGSAVVFMIGAHVIRCGVQRYLIDLMERGYVTCIAANGACVIHDWEFALIGKSTEKVSAYIRDGRFGFWKETGRINDVVAEAADLGCGLGEAIGRHITAMDFPLKEISVFGAAYRLGIPMTVHVGIGYDITHQHPNCSGAAYGAASYTDFLKFAKVLEYLEGGVVTVFGSAVMAPEVFLKALSMVRNLARQEAKPVRKFTTLVGDLFPLPENFRNEPSKEDPKYYFRPWKTLLVRTVQDGGESYYVRGSHEETIPALWTALAEAGSLRR